MVKGFSILCWEPNWVSFAKTERGCLYCDRGGMNTTETRTMRSHTKLIWRQPNMCKAQFCKRVWRTPNTNDKSASLVEEMLPGPALASKKEKTGKVKRLSGIISERLAAGTARCSLVIRSERKSYWLQTVNIKDFSGRIFSKPGSLVAEITYYWLHGHDGKYGRHRHKHECLNKRERSQQQTEHVLCSVMSWLMTNQRQFIKKWYWKQTSSKKNFR